MHCSSWNRCAVFSKAPVLHGASYGLRLRSRDICSRTSSNLYPASTGSSTYIATRCPKHVYLRHVCSTHPANSTIVFCSNRPHWLDQAAGCSVTFVRPVLPCAPTSRSVPRASPPPRSVQAAQPLTCSRNTAAQPTVRAKSAAAMAGNRQTRARSQLAVAVVPSFFLVMSLAVVGAVIACPISARRDGAYRTCPR